MKVGRRLALSLSLALLLGTLFVPAAGALTIDVDKLAIALEDSPVQVIGSPGLSRAQAHALARRIGRRDRGRIWIAVVPSLSQSQAGELAQDLADEINASGVYVVAGGSNYHVTTTWGSGEAARLRLAQAVNRPGDSVNVQMQRTIDSFAKADAADGHPGSGSLPSTTTEPSSTGTSSAPALPTGTRSSQTAGSGSTSSGSGSGGLIAGLITVLVVVALIAIFSWRKVRTSMRAAHRRKEEDADARAQAQADFSKLGDEIGALDIDSSMPNASTPGKDEYAKALDCYQDAERRLAKADDPYQFERAQDALRRGLEHVHTAERQFNPDPATHSGPPADVVEELAKLAKLHQRGALTEAEFQAEKKKLLD